MAKLVTVIIPTKNEAANIGRCLKSVQKDLAEVIVIDNYSSDQTAKIAVSAK